MSQMTSDVRWEVVGQLPVISGDRRPWVSEDEIQLAKQFMDSTGIVLFRDFDISVDNFRALTKRLGNSFSIEKWAPHSSTPGGPRIGLHTEQAFLPVIPSALWFYSAKPAGRGGATVVCDGAAVFSHLSAGARHFLEQNDILYWHRSSGKPRPSYLRCMADPPGLGRNYRESELILHDDYYETTALCRPLIHSRVGHLPVFGNHILNTVELKGHDEPPAVDGFHQARLPTKEQLPRDLIEELKSVTSQLSLKFMLGRRDIVWIDNTRFLHGRQAFEGSRQILALKAFSADQWIPGYDPADFPSRTAEPPIAIQ